MESSSADPPWKQLLKELDDPSCPLKYRYGSRLHALLTTLKPCKVLTRSTSLGPLINMSILGRSWARHASQTHFAAGCRHLTNLALGHDDFLVHPDAHSDLVPDLLCSPDAKLKLLLTVAALIHVSDWRLLPMILALAAAAVAACGTLCAFSSPQRTEVLAAVTKYCSPSSNLIPLALSDAAVLQQAERQLPGAQAALLLTMVEAHLEESDSAPGRPMLPSNCAILGAHGPQLGGMDLPVWAADLRLMPAAAAYTASLTDDRPHAVTRRCLLAVLLKAVTSSISLVGESIQEDTIEHALAVQKPALQLALHYEMRFLQQRQEHQELPHQHQQFDPATAMANCLCHLRIFTACLARVTPAMRSGQIVEQAEKLLQLQSRIMQRVTSDPLAASIPWPLARTAGASGAYTLCRSSGSGQPGDKRMRCNIRGRVQQYVDNLERLQAASSAHAGPQLAALVENLFAISIVVIEPGVPLNSNVFTPSRTTGEGHPANVALVEVMALQQVLQTFLAVQPVRSS